MPKLGGVAWIEFVLQGTSRVAILMKKVNGDGRLATRHNAVRGIYLCDRSGWRGLHCVSRA